MKDKILYYLLYGVWYAFSLLPMRVHYVLSDLIYLIVYRLIGYRRELVRRHLAGCFSTKSEQERRQIERGFYHWFCDYIVETVKLMTISKENLMKRMKFKGVELVNEAVENGQSVAVYLGHYCNWEWVTSIPYWYTPKAHSGQIYHVLENPVFDRLFLKLRHRTGAESIPMAEILRRLATYRQQKQPVVIGYISDQAPFWNNIHHWLQFLEHDTPVLTGTERLARSAGHMVLYLDMRRVKRGYYEGELKLISRDPKQTKDYELTDAYFSMLEKSILRDPQCYLWTHNRWKRSHEEFDLRYDKETGRKRTAMIFVHDKGRMANNMLQYGHVYAWGREHGRATMSMRFAYKYPWFHICHTRHHHLWNYLFAKYAAKWGLIPTVRFDTEGADYSREEQMMRDRRLILVGGWYARWYDLFLKYKPEILQLFAFDKGREHPRCDRRGESGLAREYPSGRAHPPWRLRDVPRRAFPL